LAGVVAGQKNKKGNDMKINVIRSAQPGEVFLLTFNKTIQVWNTEAEALKSAQKLVSNTDPFTAEICPVSKDYARHIVDNKNNVYCAADL
jgi:nucleoside diphosphate kinase